MVPHVVGIARDEEHPYNGAASAHARIIVQRYGPSIRAKRTIGADGTRGFTAGRSSGNSSARPVMPRRLSRGCGQKRKDNKT
jgi:hypothetical protein